MWMVRLALRAPYTFVVLAFAILVLAQIVGTLLVVSVTMLVSLPLGVGSGIYVEEYGRTNWLTALIELNIANLEAQTKQVEAMFASIDNTVNSTGDLLDGLFGNLKETENLSWRTKGLLEDQIRLENDRRQEALHRRLHQLGLPH